MVLSSALFQLLYITLCSLESLPGEGQTISIAKAHNAKLRKLSCKITPKFLLKIHVLGPYCLLFLTPVTVKKHICRLANFFSYFAHPKPFKSLCTAPSGIDAYKSNLRRLLSPSCLQTCFYTAAQTDYRCVIQLYISFTHLTPLNQNPYFKCLHQKPHGAPKKISFSATLPQAKRASPP